MSPILKLSLELIIASPLQEADAAMLDTLWNGGVAVGPLASSRHRHAAQVLEDGYQLGYLSKSFAGLYAPTAKARDAMKA
jgi:hypothetical protein